MWRDLSTHFKFCSFNRVFYVKRIRYHNFDRQCYFRFYFKISCNRVNGRWRLLGLSKSPINQWQSSRLQHDFEVNFIFQNNKLLVSLHMYVWNNLLPMVFSYCLPCSEVKAWGQLYLNTRLCFLFFYSPPYVYLWTC